MRNKTKTKTKFTFEPCYDIEQFDKDKPEENAFHFYGSSAFEWTTSVDFLEVYNYLSEVGYGFSVWFVPRHTKADYEINFYSPQGVDAHWLGTYHPNK